MKRERRNEVRAGERETAGRGGGGGVGDGKKRTKEGRQGGRKDRERGKKL